MTRLRLAAAAALAAALMCTSVVGASALALIDVFDSANGASPGGGLIADAHGALYGTTNVGGDFAACQQGCGTVFRLAPSGPGSSHWTQTVVYAFHGGSDGGFPTGALIADAHGSFYGTTAGGGAACNFGGCGTVFELSPPARGKTAWTERVLHAFRPGSDGRYPQAGLIADGHGALYGTTQAGGSDEACGGGGGCGTVFRLMPPAPGRSGWVETVLHSFAGGPDGQAPAGTLLADTGGALYGSTEFGGNTGCGGPGCGTIFKLSPPGAESAVWRNSVLHAFNGSDGMNPTTTLIADERGDLYGSGGTTVFELAAPRIGRPVWLAIVVHAFDGIGGDGQYPNGSLIVDSRGSIYGTTSAGGSGPCGCGTVFKLTAQPGALLEPGIPASWSEAILHVFNGNDGENPSTGLTVDGSGLFGATIFGGDFNACPNTGCGTIFRL